MERAIPIEAPDMVWSTGAPSPVLISSELRTFFAFHLIERAENSGRPVQAAEFIRCLSVRFGFPNDEAMGGHLLWGRGLTFYSLHVVEESSWLEEIRQTERFHPQSDPFPFPDAKHFLLTFHDSTLEAIARDVVPIGRYTSMAEATSALNAGLNDKRFGT
jgi:hypothetical protein